MARVPGPDSVFVPPAQQVDVQARRSSRPAPVGRLEQLDGHNDVLEAVLGVDLHVVVQVVHEAVDVPHECRM
jgi:hypothetical protein